MLQESKDGCVTTQIYIVMQKYQATYSCYRRQHSATLSVVAVEDPAQPPRAQEPAHPPADRARGERTRPRGRLRARDDHAHRRSRRPGDAHRDDAFPFEGGHLLRRHRGGRRARRGAARAPAPATPSIAYARGSAPRRSVPNGSPEDPRDPAPAQPRDHPRPRPPRPPGPPLRPRAHRDRPRGRRRHRAGPRRGRAADDRRGRRSRCWTSFSAWWSSSRINRRRSSSAASASCAAR